MVLTHHNVSNVEEQEFLYVMLQKEVCAFSLSEVTRFLFTDKKIWKLNVSLNLGSTYWMDGQAANAKLALML